MMRTHWRNLIGFAAVLAVGGSDVSAAHAQDFFANLFGGFSRRIERSYVRMPFAPELDVDRSGYGVNAMPNDGPAPYSSGAGQAFCVRTCDGRYFPISSGDSQTKASSCNNFCPASETRVFYGSTIDHAVSENGRRYGDLPNAFKYRTELVAGCTCNGKATGLAPVKIDDDATLRRGDIVADANGLMVNRGNDRRGASLNLTPVSPSIRARYERSPTLATD